jgi:hypothetical protein
MGALIEGGGVFAQLGARPGRGAIQSAIGDLNYHLDLTKRRSPKKDVRRLDPETLTC